MKTMLICFVLLYGAAGLGAQTPEWQWAVGAGGPSSDYGRSIAIDSQGNQYVTGYFSGTATFGSNSITSSGDEWHGDIFVAKLDSNGNWLWTVKAGGTGYEHGYGIAVDGVGNAYVTGSFEGTATFGSYILTASGSYDIFVAKLDSNGNWLWAVKAGGTTWDHGRGIVVDGVGNAYVTGKFRDTASFGSHTITASGYDDIFVTKLDSSGSWLWAVKAGGTSYYYDEGWGIALDGAGNAYVTGYFSGSSTFGSHILTASGRTDVFAAKLDPSGNWIWASKAGGTGYEEGLGIAVDGVGNAYVTGYFQDTAYFGGHTLTASAYDVFAAKLEPSGNWLWAVKAGGTGNDYGLGIAVDGGENAYVTGNFKYTATFGNHTLTESGGFENDIFAAELDPIGNWHWAVKAGGTSYDEGYAIAVDGVGNAYVTGSFQGTATFGSDILTGSGVGEIFVAKLGSGTPVEEDLAPEAVARLYNAWPNPLGRVASALIKADIAERSTGTLNIFNLRGQIVARHELGPGPHQISFGGGDLPAGVYLYSLQCGTYRETKKLVLLK